jgi:hypothetical protein
MLAVILRKAITCATESLDKEITQSIVEKSTSIWLIPHHVRQNNTGGD